MEYYVLSYAFMAMEALALCVVANLLFQCRFKSKTIQYAIIFSFVGFMALLTGTVLQEIDPYSRVVVNLFLLFSLVQINYRNAVSGKILLTISFFVINSVIDYSILSLSMITSHYSYDALTRDKGFYLIGAFTAKTILLTLAALFAKARRKKKSEAGSLTITSWLGMLVIPVFSIVILHLIVQNAMNYNNIGPWVIVITVGLLLCNVVIFFLWDRLEEEQRIILESELQRINSQRDMEKMKALEAAYAQQRRQTHDYNSHLQTILGLLTAGAYNKALEYVQGCTDRSSCEELIVHTNNPIADMVLNQAYRSAQEKGIFINYWIEDLAELPVSDVEFVTVLSNLLDNAVEAASRCTNKKEVHVKIHYVNDKLFVSVRNTTLPVKIVDGQIKTTKKDSFKHGYGLSNVVRIVKQHHGEYTLAQQEGWFQFTAFFNTNQQITPQNV